MKPVPSAVVLMDIPTGRFRTRLAGVDRVDLFGIDTADARMHDNEPDHYSHRENISADPKRSKRSLWGKNEATRIAGTYPRDKLVETILRWLIPDPTSDMTW